MPAFSHNASSIGVIGSRKLPESKYTGYGNGSGSTVTADNESQSETESSVTRTSVSNSYSNRTGCRRSIHSNDSSALCSELSSTRVAGLSDSLCDFFEERRLQAQAKANTATNGALSGNNINAASNQSNLTGMSASASNSTNSTTRNFTPSSYLNESCSRPVHLDEKKHRLHEGSHEKQLSQHEKRGQNPNKSRYAQSGLSGTCGGKYVDNATALDRRDPQKFNSGEALRSRAFEDAVKGRKRFIEENGIGLSVGGSSDSNGLSEIGNSVNHKVDCYASLQQLACGEGSRVMNVHELRKVRDLNGTMGRDYKYIQPIWWGDGQK